MRLFHSPNSPFVRKVMVVAIELDIDARFELLPCAAHPIKRDQSIVARNPLGKIPTLITDDDVILYDSAVICEYLDAIAPTGSLFPPSGSARWIALRDQSLADGMLDAGLLVRYENMIRPETCRYLPWVEGQMDKIVDCLQTIEANAAELRARLDIGTIAIGCALGYLDFRYPQLDWRRGCPVAASWFDVFGQRRSMLQSEPSAGQRA